MNNKLKEQLLNEKSKNPIVIFTSLVNKDEIPMHGPIHHFIDGATILTAIHNVQNDFDLSEALDELFNRAETMPGAICGNWGVCGSASSVGAALSILHKSGPLSSDEHYKNHMELVSRILHKISEVGGPRCCKRNAYISLSTTIQFLKEKYNIDLEISDIKCDFSNKNNQCIGAKCPYNKNN